MANVLPPGKSQFLDGNGQPLAAGLVYIYQPGTTTPVTTYQDEGATIPNTNPIVLDGSGCALIYAPGGSYRQIVNDCDGNLIWDCITTCTDAGGTISSIAGDLSVGGKLSTSRAATTGNLDVGGVLSSKTLSTSSDAAIAGSMSVTGTLTGYNTASFQSLYTTGVANITGNLTSLGFANLASLGVPGNSIFNGTVVCAPVGQNAQSIYGAIGTTGFHDQVQGVAFMPGTVGVETGQYTAVAGYVRNQAAQNFSAGQPNGVALFGAGTSEADYACTWGINTILQDNASRSGAATGQGRRLLNEFDFNVTCSNTIISGLNLTGSSLVKPSSSTGIGVLPLGTNIAWDQALWSTDGAATYTTVAGLASKTLTANGNSQSHLYEYGDRTATRQFARTYVEGNPNGAGGIFVIDGGGVALGVQVASGFMQLGGGGTFLIGTQQVLGPRIPGWGAPRGGTAVQLDPNTGTLPQLISAFNALIFHLQTHGMIGQ